MKRRAYIFAGIAILALLLTVGGCASGVAVEDFEAQISSLNEKIEAQNSSLNEKIEAVELKLTDSESQVASLSTMSAYQLWFDQYYSLGTYTFPDVKSFNSSCGLLIKEVNNGNTVTSWNLYIQADKAYYDLLDSLPEDTATWTLEQYNQWLELNEARSDALGQVGATLFSAIGSTR